MGLCPKPHDLLKKVDQNFCIWVRLDFASFWGQKISRDFLSAQAVKRRKESSLSFRGFSSCAPHFFTPRREEIQNDSAHCVIRGARGVQAPLASLVFYLTDQSKFEKFYTKRG